jgi:hypothetical protein
MCPDMRDTEVEQHRIFSRMKNAVGPGSHYLVARQKAKDGEDPLKTGTNEEGMGTSFPFGGFQRVADSTLWSGWCRKGGQRLLSTLI